MDAKRSRNEELESIVVRVLRVDLSEDLLLPGSVARANCFIDISGRCAALPIDAVWLAQCFFCGSKNPSSALTADATVARTARTRRINMKMTTIVGIFDNARDLDKAVERLSRAGFEDTVYDEAIVSEELGNVRWDLCAGVWSGGVLGRYRTRFETQAGSAR